MNGDRPAPGSSASTAPAAWEYLIVALPAFKPATATQGRSESVLVLNHEGAAGWEAVGMTALDNGDVAVLMKRPISQRPA